MRGPSLFDVYDLTQNDPTMAQTVETNAGLGHAWQKNDVPFHRSGAFSQIGAALTQSCAPDESLQALQACVTPTQQVLSITHLGLPNK